jgi:hypothetical protein
MKLKKLIISGFRGFNSERTIEFHEKLTLISAPNSHGKTSITEALEFLWYGQTSKVASADSKEEYKDSYTNRHHPTASTSFIEAHCADPISGDVVFRVESNATGVRRFVNGKETSVWPFEAELATSARPFVVQHALKSLLLAAPNVRFQGFAQLLGLWEIDSMQQVLVNLCTKPEVHIPATARKLLADLDIFDGRLRSAKDTQPIAKSLASGSSGVDDAFAKLHSRGCKLLGKTVPESELPSSLVALRNAAAAKIYSGSVAIGSLNSTSQHKALVTREKIERLLKTDLLESYTRLALGDAADRLRKELQVLGLGLELVSDQPDTCPFCEQPISKSIRESAKDRHDKLRATIGNGIDISTARADMAASLKELTSSLSTHATLQLERSNELIAANTPEASQKIKALFGKGNEHSLLLVAAAGAAISPASKKLAKAQADSQNAIAVCTDAIHRKAEDVAQVEALIKFLVEYLRSADEYTEKLNDVSPTLAEPTALLQEAIDRQAGTSELSMLIEVLSNRAGIRRAVRIRETLDGLKQLKKHVDQAVGQTMEDAFSTELTGAVMGWYKRIRTTGDPDVHFSGFAMERTKTGDFKNRRVKVAARSYGVELASAVSSLSESKLNALGLCMSIATAIRAPGPWDFLVLDDPIQSWDDDHEYQFIDVIRALIEEEDRQIVLMSHRDAWIDQVADGCRSQNGFRYHITGYTKDGPMLKRSDWASIEERLKEILAIANDPSATPVRLQHAEEEVRIAVCQLTAEVSRIKLGRPTSGHSINSAKARTILTEAGCQGTLIDRVNASFSTTDPSHHAPKNYAPNAERVRQYYGMLTDLRNWLGGKL